MKYKGYITRLSLQSQQLKYSMTTAKEEILALAQQHKIRHQHNMLDRLGENICRLSDNESELDEIQWLLIELARAGIFKQREDLVLSARYTEERKNAIRSI